MGKYCLQDTDTKAFIVFWVLGFFFVYLFEVFCTAFQGQNVTIQARMKRHFLFLIYSFTDFLQVLKFF